jgi:hypothetical protein
MAPGLLEAVDVHFAEQNASDIAEGDAELFAKLL